MMKRKILRNATLVSLLALTVAISACDSNDDDNPVAATTDGLVDDDPDGAADDGAADGAADDGAADGAADDGAADGAADDGAADGSADDGSADGGASDGGSDDDGSGGAPAGSVTVSFTNTSATQPMTPPVVALHNAPDADNGVRVFEVGQPASLEVIEIAENGDFMPLVSRALAEIDNGSISEAGVAFTDAENPGPLLPGASASVTLNLAGDDQVLSVVSMVVCTNDGFSGVDSRPLSAEASDTFTAPIYDAGSETNVLTLDYWVPPCGGEGNRGDDENGSIMAHPGQSGSENPDFDFEAGTELLEVTVTRN